MLHYAVGACIVVLFGADFISRLGTCQYHLSAITRVAYERANGIACTQERSLYIGAMSPSCADYEAQLESSWQLSYQLRCILNSYDVLHTWWFYFTVLALMAYAIRLAIAKPEPVVTYLAYQPPNQRGLSLMPSKHK